MTTLNEELLIRIAADVSDLKSGMSQAKESVKGVGTAGTEAGKKVETANKSILQSAQAVRRTYTSIVGLFTLVGSAIAAATVPFFKLDDAMKELEANAKKAGGGFGDLKSQIMDVANATSSVASDVAESVNKGLASFGGDVQKSIAGTKAALKAEFLGVMTEQEARAALAPVVRAYNVSADDIEKAMATIQEGVKQGAGDPGALAQGLVEVSREALKSKVSLDQIAAAFVNLTQNGASTGEAVQIVKTALDASLAPTKEQSAAAMELFGNWSQGAIYGGNFADVLQRMRDAALAGSPALEAFLGGSQSLAQALAGFSSGGDSFATTMGAMTQAVADFNVNVEASKSKLDAMKQEVAALQTQLSQVPDSAFWKWLTSGAPNPARGTGSREFAVGGAFATGGTVPGVGQGDTVPAMLTPGEFVIRKKVADQMRPFLSQLNAGNTDLMSLWNTALANTLVKGTRMKLLDALGIAHPQRGLAGTSFNAAYGASGERVSMLASSILGKFQSIKLAHGGSVPAQRMASGGSVAPRVSRSTSISGGVTINVQGRTFSKSFIRRELAPELERLAGKGQSRRKRTGR